MMKKIIFIFSALCVANIFSSEKFPKESELTPADKKVIILVDSNTRLKSDGTCTVLWQRDTYLATIPDLWLGELREEYAKKMTVSENRKNSILQKVGDELNNLCIALYKLKTTDMEKLRALPDEESKEAVEKTKETEKATNKAESPKK